MATVGVKGLSTQRFTMHSNGTTPTVLLTCTVICIQFICISV